MTKAFSLILLFAALSTPAAALDGTIPSRDGATIRFHVEGPGASERPAVVLVHCWACDRHLWDGTLPALAKSYRVITLDLAGHGDSTRGERKDFTIAAFGEDVSTVVESVGPKKVILVGHSMGGPVALEAARRLGHRVVGIVPVDTLTHVDGGLRPEELDAFFAPFYADYPAAVEKFIRAWMFLPGADPKLIDGIVARAVSTPAEVGLSALQNAFRNDARPALRELRVPIHALNADKFPTNADAARRYAPQFDATILKGHGHYLMLENPSEFGEALGRILADMSATASEPGSEARAALFDEDSTVPLDARRGRATESEGITEMDLLFPSPKGGSVPATLVFPPGAGPFAAIVFMHPGSGPGSQRESSRSSSTRRSRVPRKTRRRFSASPTGTGTESCRVWSMSGARSTSWERGPRWMRTASRSSVRATARLWARFWPAWRSASKRSSSSREQRSSPDSSRRFPLPASRSSRSPASSTCTSTG